MASADSLVDGGYAHDTPLEAVRLSGARQVLIVESSPRTETRDEGPGHTPLSRLAGNVVRLLPFMFEQSQGVDRNVASSLMVASLAPRLRRGGVPVPGRLRPAVVTKMVDCASSWAYL